MFRVVSRPLALGVALSVALLAAALSAGIARAATPTAAAIPQLALDYGAAWSSGDPERLGRLYAEDGVFEEVVLGGIVTHDRAGLRQYADEVYAAFPDFAATPVAGFAVGDRVLLEWVLTGTYEGTFGTLPPGTGQTVEVRIASVLTLNENGLIQHDRAYWDLATFLDQLGLMPTAEAAATPAA